MIVNNQPDFVLLVGSRAVVEASTSAKIYKPSGLVIFSIFEKNKHNTDQILLL